MTNEELEEIAHTLYLHDLAQDNLPADSKDRDWDAVKNAYLQSVGVVRRAMYKVINERNDGTASGPDNGVQPEYNI